MRFRTICIAIALFIAPLAAAAPAEDAVRALERRWLDAYEQRDAAAMDAILAPGFTITYPDGTVQQRDAVIAFIEKHKAEPAPRFHTEETTATTYGSTVVLRGIVVTESKDGANVRRTAQRYTDTYVQLDGRWRVAASHLSSIDKKSEALTLRETEVRHLVARSNGIAYKVYVSLPTGYASSTARYPVLYLLDADYSFPIARAIVQHLSDRQRLKPLIVVGIAYDGPDQYRLNRTRDYTPRFFATGGYGEELQKNSGGGPKFLKFIREELFPEIDSHYRTDPKERGLTGHSYGGLFTNWVLLTAPDAFNRYIIVSPSLWYAERFMFGEEKASRARPAPAARAYFAVGAREGNAEHDMVVDLKRMASALSERPSLAVKQEVFDDETHDSVFPTAVSRGIRFVFGGD